MSNVHPGDPAARKLMAALIAASTFEEAARLTLTAILDVVSGALRSSTFADVGAVRRAVIHLRPSGAYRQLVVLEAPDDESSAPPPHDRRLLSTTAWRWIADRKRAISIDVNLATVRLNPEDGALGMSDKLSVDREFAGHETRVRFIERDVTHLLVIPLHIANETVAGMISVEVDCRAAMGMPFIWPRCTAQAQFMADLSALYLTTLPASSAAVGEADAFLPVIGPSMSATVKMLMVFAQQSEPILLHGPTGTGKSRLARWCHEHSSVRDKPFEILDLSAIPDELQMAELFGWKKGAFTGAGRDNAGVIARAQGGTLFIDEIGNLSLRAQAGLLHVLEERTYRVLGDGAAEKEADVRFIIGTNENLQNAVRAKRFREDLFYRINVLPVSVPPLNERADEIPLWARYMVNRQHRKSGQMGTAEISPAARDVLLRQSWPGNLRQLDNIIRRAYAIALMPRGGSRDANVVLEGDHVERALAYDSPASANQSVQALLAAAAACVDQACARGGEGALDIDLIDGFKGLVLGVALEKLGGNREEVFNLFGRAKLVAGRNHHKVFRRELERAKQFCAALSDSTAFPFAAFITEGDDAAIKVHQPTIVDLSEA
jgi:DNA-binding NtrC family response regulator